MSRLGITDLPKPPKKYRVRGGVLEDGSWFAFETSEEAQSEDEHRARLLSRLLDKKRPITHLWTRRAIASIIHRIGEASTIASLVVMRGCRKIIAGNLLRLLRNRDDVRFFTLLPNNWVYSEGALGDADPKRLMESLRQLIRRRSAGYADGWLIAFIDGEYEPSSKTFRLHVHGLVCGELIGAVEDLKGSSNFQVLQTSDQSVSPRQPVRLQKISRTPIRAITYCIKGFWCERASFEDQEGQLRRQRDKRRIKCLQPFAEHLLWLDSWRLQDLTLLMGISVTRSGFKISKK